MKLAYLANIRFPSKRAHAIQIAHMCQAMTNEGMEVDLFVNKRSISTKIEIDQWFDKKTNFKVFYQSPKFFYPKLRFTFYLSELFFTLNFLIRVGTKKYDVLFVRSEWIAYSASFFVGDNKIIWESHEAKYNFPAKSILKKGIRCICISEGVKEFYEEKGIPSAQMLIAHDAVDNSFFETPVSKQFARKELGLALDEKIAMYIGNFNKWKGIESFFKASEFSPDISFVAIGGLEEEIVFYKQKYPQVIFLGQKPYAKLVINQQAADVLVVPNTADNSLSKNFTSPLKLFAHMASGIPLVVSNIDSLVRVTGTEFVSVAKPDNPEDLSETIEKVLLEMDLSKSKAAQLKILSTRYTWENRVRSIKDFIYGKTTE